MTRTTVPASKGSATFVDSQVVVDLTVLNTLPGDVVEIIDDTSLVVLGTALQVGTGKVFAVQPGLVLTA